jgi:hypothetical protein
MVHEGGGGYIRKDSGEEEGGVGEGFTADEDLST